MISETVRRQIHTRALEMATTHPAVACAKQGNVGSRNVANYLASLRFLLSHTVPHLRQARARAADLGQGELTAFLEQKIVEEDGHEKWAEDDLRELGGRRGGTTDGKPLPAIVELVDYLADLSGTEPQLYIVYSLCTEYFTVVAGPTWIRALTEHCGVPASALTAVSKHVEADQAHAAYGFAVLDRLIPDPAMTSAVTGTVERTLGLFDQFFREVVSASN